MPNKRRANAPKMRGGNSTMTAVPKTTAKTITAPTAKGVIIRQKLAPTMASTPNGVILSNSEIVSVPNVATSGTIGKQRTDLTPRAFGWAAGVATNYTYFRFKKLAFRFISTSPSTRDGYFDMAIANDTDDAALWMVGSTYNNLDQFQHFTSGPIWGQDSGSTSKPGITLVVDCSRLHARVPWYRVDTNGPTSAELAQNTAGSLLTAAFSSATGAVGRVFVDYTLEFLDPVSPINNA